MTKREHILLRALVFLIIFVSAVFIFYSYYENITYTNTKIAEYAEALQQLPAVSKEERDLLIKQLEEIQKPLLSDEKIYSIADITKIIKEDLARNTIIPKKIQITENKSIAMVEFTISCSPELFFIFLKDSNKHDSIFSIEYLVIKTTDSGIDILLRVKHA